MSSESEEDVGLDAFAESEAVADVDALRPDTADAEDGADERADEFNAAEADADTALLAATLVGAGEGAAFELT